MNSSINILLIPLFGALGIYFPLRKGGSASPHALPEFTEVLNLFNLLDLHDSARIFGQGRKDFGGILGHKNDLSTRRGHNAIGISPLSGWLSDEVV
jgi:hypothetical protein